MTDKELWDNIEKNHRDILRENGVEGDGKGIMVCTSCRKLVQFDSQDNAYCGCRDERVQR